MTRTYTAITNELADYIGNVTLREPEPLKRLRESTQDHPHASWCSAPEQIQFLNLMAVLLGARKTIEVGVFLGYSSGWVALALPPDGKLVACERSPEYAAIARRAWQELGVERKIDFRLGPALDTLDTLISGGQAGTFDMVFIDADKTNYANYYERALVLLRKGGLIALDNVLWGGDVINPAVQDADTRAIRAFNEKVHHDTRVALSMATMGDGLTLACKL
jgi:predicted O-methyltransferase YrrM